MLLRDLSAVRVFHAAPDRPGGRPALECVMLDVAEGPSVLLPRNVAHAAASPVFADFMKAHAPEVERVERTVSDARELNELRDRVIRMRARRPRIPEPRQSARAPE